MILLNVDSTVADRNDVYVQLAWKSDVDNTCDTAFRVAVTFTAYDAQDFKLASDTEYITVHPKTIGKAKGTALLRLAIMQRIAKQRASVSRILQEDPQS